MNRREFLIALGRVSAVAVMAPAAVLATRDRFELARQCALPVQRDGFLLMLHGGGGSIEKWADRICEVSRIGRRLPDGVWGFVEQP